MLALSNRRFTNLKHKDMIVIPNNIIPFPGFLAINLFELVFVRKEYWDERSETDKAITLNHEAIHTAQMRELLWVFFYIIYFFEWLIRLCFINGSQAYEKTSFEVEAYDNQACAEYLKHRKHYAQWRKK